MTEQNEQELAELTELYGTPARYSEHERGSHIRYVGADGVITSGTIIWIQERFESIPQKLVIAPDEPGAFLDFAMPADVLQVEDVTQDALHDCPYCTGKHYDVEQCPLKPH